MIGGLTSVLASWLVTRTQARGQWLAQDILRRQDLYKEFIEQGSQCHIHALQHLSNKARNAIFTRYNTTKRML
jgi:hypothetical protein